MKKPIFLQVSVAQYDERPTRDHSSHSGVRFLAFIQGNNCAQLLHPPVQIDTLRDEKEKKSKNL